MRSAKPIAQSADRAIAASGTGDSFVDKRLFVETNAEAAARSVVRHNIRCPVLAQKHRSARLPSAASSATKPARRGLRPIRVGYDAGQIMGAVASPLQCDHEAGKIDAIPDN